MNLEQYFKPVYQKIEACEGAAEVWPSQHREALEVLDIEVLLGDMVEISATIDRIETAVLDAGNRQSIASDDKLVDLVRELRKHFALACIYVDAKAKEYSNDYGVENYADFQTVMQRASDASAVDYLPVASERVKSQAAKICGIYDFDVNS